jgi:hypothetical protein
MTPTAHALVLEYLAVRHTDRVMTAPAAAGFFIAQFGALESIRRLEKQGLNQISNYYKEVIEHLKRAA